MDITLQIRTFDLISKFLRHDMEGLPHYGYTVQKPPFPLQGDTDKSTHLKRAVPEALGIRSEAITDFLDHITRNEQKFGIHGFMLLRHGQVASEQYFAPYLPHVPHMLYSMSKSFTGTAVGMLIDDGLLSLDEKICDIFPDEMPKSAILFGTPVSDITIRHLLTMTSGSRFNESGSVLDSKWVENFLEASLKFDPGEQFNYNSMNTYMLAAAVVKRTGSSLTKFLQTRLFEPLGIGSHEWEKCPDGIEKGGWGLALTLEDTAKLGQLYLNRGVHNGRRLLSEEFIQAATSKQIDTQPDKNKSGYGYQIWIGEKHGAFMFNGAFGQYVIVIPEYDAVAAIFSGNTTLFSQNDLFDRVYSLAETFTDAPLESCDLAKNTLAEVSRSLRVLNAFGTGGINMLRSYERESAITLSGFEAFANAVDGKEFRFFKKAGSLFPMTLQTVHCNFSAGVDTVSFKKGIGSLMISFYETMERNTLTVKSSGSFTYTRVSHKGERQIVGTRGVWSDDGKTLFILASFIETPDTRIIKLTLEDDGTLSVLFDERPTLDGSFTMFLKLIGMSERAFFKGIMKNTDKNNNIAATIRSFTMPTIVGKPVKFNEE